MELLKRFFGLSGDKKDHDPQGVYLYVECDRCGAQVKVRADKKYDLNRTDEGYTWHKTIVDSKCFQQMPTTVRFDRNYNVIEAEIEGGHYISQEAYEAPADPEPAVEESKSEPNQE